MATGIPAARLAFYVDHQTPTPYLVDSLEWEDVVELFAEHTFTECRPCPGGQSCKAKFTEAFSPGAPRAGKGRGNENVESVSLLVFDFDHLTRAELGWVCDQLAGLECVLYSTHSHGHGGPDDCCVRIVFPLARALLPHEFRHVRAAVIARYGLEWLRPGAKVKSGADPNPKDLSRLFFLPTAPIGTEVEAGHQTGALLDLNEFLKGCPQPEERRGVTAPPSTSAPFASQPLTVDMEGLRELLKKYKPKHEERDEGEMISRKELVRRVLQQEPLVRAEEEGQREKSCHRLGKILSYLLPITTPEEVVTELVRPSVSKMPVYDDDDANDALDQRFLKLSYSWRRGLGEREVQEQAFQAERAASKERTQKLRERFKLKGREPETVALPLPAPPGSPPDDGGPPGAATPPPPPDDEPDDAWEELLIYRQTKQGPVLREMLANVIIILSMHPDWEGALKYNEITKNVDVVHSPLELYEKTPNSLITATQNWLQARYEANFSVGDVQNGLLHVARSNAYNPLKDYLNGAQWDGVSRIDTFLEGYCGAALIDREGLDISEYVRKVSRRWLLSAVARGLQPGCKMDTVLILEGRTGIYKSTALKALGGKFFSDSKIVIGEKDAMMLAGTNWIHEIAELTAFHASETETQKAFFSSATDNFRAPYDRVLDHYPRLACFVGSTNEERYLNDHTGNRRYLPICCDRPFRIQELRRDRDLLWAEAAAVYKAGLTCLKCQALNVGLPSPWHEQYAHLRCELHRWWFDNDENEMLERVNVHRLRADFAEAIRDYILRLSPERRRESYTLFEIASDMLKLQPDRIQSQTPAIGRALKVLGFEKDRVMHVADDKPGEKVQIRVFKTPELLMKAAKKESAHLTLVDGGKVNAK